MTVFDPADHPHRRYDPLRGEWILVSPHRAKRPWQGQADMPEQSSAIVHDSQCYLCPGNRRVTGHINPDYRGPFIFDNDFAALLPDRVTTTEVQDNPLFQLEPATGTSRVICFSPDHSRTLARMAASEIAAVVDMWCAQAADLGRHYAHVQIFENKGAMMGCSNPHPHGQVWASMHVPHDVATEDGTQRDWLVRHGTPMLDQLAQAESGGPRVIVETRFWLVIIPFWARWPFETLILPRFAVHRLPDLSADQRHDLADALRQLLVRYDNLFLCSFPYSMGWHGAPFGMNGPTHWTLHAHVYPPLLRSASVRKFMIGYEMLAESQRDLTPEQAAKMLRAVSDIHYADQGVTA